MGATAPTITRALIKIFIIFFSDKKEKWVPVEVNITTKRPGAKAGSSRKSDSKNWREDSAAAAEAANSKGNRQTLG